MSSIILMVVSDFFIGSGEDEPKRSGVPTIIDHGNNDFILWESNAILKYLVETYDKEHKFYFPAGTKESLLVDQWLFFQASGQVSPSTHLSIQLS